LAWNNEKRYGLYQRYNSTSHHQLALIIGYIFRSYFHVLVGGSQYLENVSVPFSTQSFPDAMRHCLTHINDPTLADDVSMIAAGAMLRV
jgi:hypothetical protein